MEEKTETKPKKSLWSLLKESMDKTSNGCGPSCGCHVEKQDDKNRQAEDRPPPPMGGNETERP